jgi:phosphopantothenoylcysteine decarboxylase/phosphopantothenate--cysteine ligase
MAEPEEIVAHAARCVRGTGALSGRRVVVTAGPTREPLDPVRLLTNRSSGKMGYRLAEAAWQRGAEVTLISGPSGERQPVGVPVIRVDTAAEMATAIREQIGVADVLIMAAAPADYRVAKPRDSKLSRAAGVLAIELVPTDDILLATLPDRPAGLTSVGFALETGDGRAKGLAKLKRKQLDLIVVNDLHDAGAGFEVDTNQVTILDRRGTVTPVSLRSKAEIADAILDAIEKYRE